MPYSTQLPLGHFDVCVDKKVSCLSSLISHLRRRSTKHGKSLEREQKTCLIQKNQRRRLKRSPFCYSLEFHVQFSSGDRINNWEFSRQQWEDYELATAVDKRPEAIRLATLRSLMGKDCLQIFLNLKLTPEKKACNACLSYFVKSG